MYRVELTSLLAVPPIHLGPVQDQGLSRGTKGTHGIPRWRSCSIESSHLVQIGMQSLQSTLAWSHLTYIGSLCIVEYQVCSNVEQNSKKTRSSRNCQVRKTRRTGRSRALGTSEEDFAEGTCMPRAADWHAVPILEEAASRRLEMSKGGPPIDAR